MQKFFSRRMATILLLANVGSGAVAAQPVQSPQLSADYAKWRNYILPSPSEQSYRRIPWRASVLHGIIDAQTSEKPIMIVLMNGHPLGCT